MFWVFAQSSGTRSRVRTLQRGAIVGDRLLQSLSAILALAERAERVPEVVLGRGPLQRDTLARPHLQGGAVGGDRPLEPVVFALLFPEHIVCEPERVPDAAALVRVQAGRQGGAEMRQSGGSRLQQVDQIVPLALGRRCHASSDEGHQHGVEITVEIERQSRIGQRVFAGAASF